MQNQEHRARDYRELFVGSGTGLGYNQENDPGCAVRLSDWQTEREKKKGRKYLSQKIQLYIIRQNNLSINY